jgi:hypothetical protein
MVANDRPREPEKKESGLTLKGVSNFLIGILLALTIKVTLETTFRDLGQYNDLIEAVTTGVWGDFRRKVLILFQFPVFIFTLLRFYWGAYRCNNEMPESQTKGGLAINVLGAFLLFGGFYITAMSIQTTKLFYSLIVIFHVLDWLWFLIANAHVKKIDASLLTVTSCWQFFDLITVVLFLGASWGLDLLFPPAYYVPQYFSLAVLFGVGIWDFKKFWPFYMDEPDWRTKLA